MKQMTPFPKPFSPQGEVGASDGCGTRVAGRDHEQRIKELEAEVAKFRAAFHRESKTVDSLHDRIQDLEPENAALKNERDCLRKIIGDLFEAETFHAEMAKKYAPQGCVCPADAQLNCHAPNCPRKPWTVTSATSQPHHPYPFTTWRGDTPCDP